MSTGEITKIYTGHSKEYLLPKEILAIFDILWGEDNRHLPKYPAVIGGLSAIWYGTDSSHKVSHMDEIINAYEKRLTARITITGKINDSPRSTFVYVPNEKQVRVQISAKTEKLADEKIELIKEICPMPNIPIVFISYATDEVELADYLKGVLERITDKKVEIFIAKRMVAGVDPLKTMLEENLKKASVVIPICSINSKESPWLWWEASSAWARGEKVYPLHTNISMGKFNGPLNLIAQGKDFFIPKELEETLKEICENFGLQSTSCCLNENENKQLSDFKNKYSTHPMPADVEIGYKILHQEPDLHKYSLDFGVTNTSKESFKNIVLELYFPEKYLDQTDWKYDHLKSSSPIKMPEYLCLIFNFSTMPERAKIKFINSLLPGKTLKIFGEDGITRLHYHMTHDIYHGHAKFEVRWKVYIDGKSHQEGLVPLNTLQNF